MFSVPQDSANDAQGRFNRVRGPLGRDYQRMHDSLWYPAVHHREPGHNDQPVRLRQEPGSAAGDGRHLLRHGADAGLQPVQQPSALQNFNPSPAPAGMPGGWAARVAQKIVILETDGLPNTTAGAASSITARTTRYYKVRYNSTNPGASEFPRSGTWATTCLGLPAKFMTIFTTLPTWIGQNSPGHATPRQAGAGSMHRLWADRRRVLLKSGSALATLQQIQYIGGTQTSPSDAAAVQDHQWHRSRHEPKTATSPHRHPPGGHPGGLVVLTRVRVPTLGTGPTPSGLPGFSRTGRAGGTRGSAHFRLCAARKLDLIQMLMRQKNSHRLPAAC